MEFRKIIAFGKSSFVISLPKAWLEANKLIKGDVVFLEQEEDKLMLVPKEKNTEKEESTILVNIDNKDLSRIKREIYSGFLNYNSKIVIEGKEVAKYATELTDLIQRLIALEIVEQTSEKIVAKDFLRVEDVSVKDYLRKADIVIRSTLTDLKDPTFTNYQELMDRQLNVKRAYLLLLKIFKAVLKDLSLMKKLDIKSEDLLAFYRYNIALQRISNCLNVIAKNIGKVNAADKKKIQGFIGSLSDNYVKILKAMHLENPDKAYELTGIRDKEVSIINAELKPKTESLKRIGERLVWTYFELHEILHRIYS